MLSDKNNDGRFCKVETKMLVLKISLALQEYGVEFDEGKFYRVMSKDPSVIRTLTILKRLVPTLDDEEESISSGESEDEDNDAYDMFHMIEGSYHGSSISGSIPIEGRQQSSGGLKGLSLSQPRRRASVSRGSIVSRGSRSSVSRGGRRKSIPTIPNRQDPPVYMSPPPPGTTSDATPERRRKRDFLKRMLEKDVDT